MIITHFKQPIVYLSKTYILFKYISMFQSIKTIIRLPLQYCKSKATHSMLYKYPKHADCTDTFHMVTTCLTWKTSDYKIQN